MRADQALSGPGAQAPRWRQAFGLAWLFLALAGLSVLASVAGSREPDYSMAVETAQCRNLAPDGAVASPDRIIHLPLVERAEPASTGAVLQCDFELSLTADEARNAALLIPSFADAVTVQVNGRRIAVAERYMMRDLRLTTLPAFVPNLGGVLEPGVNRFRVTLATLPGRTAALDRIFIGGRSELRPYYHARWFAVAVLPTVIVGAETALACIFALIWMARPRESEFGWIAATFALAAARGSVLIPDFGFGGERPIWNALVAWEAMAALMFCRALVGPAGLRSAGLLAIPPFLLTVTYLLAPSTEVLHLALYGVMGLVAAYLGMAAWTLARAALRGDRDALVVAPGVVMLLVFVVRDVATIVSDAPARVFLARAAYGGFLAAVATLMTLRFIRAMRKADETAVVLRERVAEVEAELRGTYEELRARREAEVVERERTRLMRDLHDGLGGELASILALADGPRPSPREIAGHARAALTDMRLIIGSLEDYGGDLSLMLGAWRERAEPQLRAAGLALVWNVGDVPQLAWLGPAQALDVLRIVQEAATNVMKHARATRLRVDVCGDAQGVAVAVCDNGEAFAPAGGGHGIGNMRARAARLGADLTIGRAEGETCVRLWLPHAPSPRREGGREPHKHGMSA